AANAIRLSASAADAHVMIAAGPHNRPARLALGETSARPGLDGPVIAHFRSEAARLIDPNSGGEDELVLRGVIDQASYPGGFWRYGVKVGEARYLVDDPRRLTVGADVGIQLPAPALHLYRAAGDAMNR